MATLVAKEYANWDRADLRFPFMRTFDLWAGHSWAGGTSSPGGENQESSSEAVQSWAGLIYLGEALGDQKMRDAGIMGYAVETQATLEYWFNAGGDVFPAGMETPGHRHGLERRKSLRNLLHRRPRLDLRHPMAARIADAVLPRPRPRLRPQKLREHVQGLRSARAGRGSERSPSRARKPHEAKKATIKNFGPALGSVMLGYVLMYDPRWACEQLDTLWNQPGDKIAHDASEMAIIYYLAHSTRTLGEVDWTCHGSSPTSMVYKNNATKLAPHLVWNPSTAAETVIFYEGGKAAGQVVAEPRSLTSVDALVPLARTR